MTKKRVTWIDCAKGLGILLVIVGHTVSGGTRGSLFRALVFSFHMPFFFILSSTTYRYSTSLEEFCSKTKKAFRHLVIPVFALFVIAQIITVFRDPASARSLEYWRDRLYCLILGSGVSWRFGDITIPALGIPWFLYALFLSRTLYDYLQLYIPPQQLQITVWVIAFIGVAVGSNQNYLPFSLDIALAALPFFPFGVIMKTRSKAEPSPLLFAVCAAIWLFLVRFTTPNTSNWTYLELAARRYPFFPLCYLAAVAGSLMVCEVGKWASRFKYLSRPIIYIGRDSLYLLMIHHLDTFWYRTWIVENHQFYSAGKRILVDLFVFTMFELLRTVMTHRKRIRMHDS